MIKTEQAAHCTLWRPECGHYKCVQGVVGFIHTKVFRETMALQFCEHWALRHAHIRSTVCLLFHFLSWPGIRIITAGIWSSWSSPHFEITPSDFGLVLNLLLLFLQWFGLVPIPWLPTVLLRIMPSCPVLDLGRFFPAVSCGRSLPELVGCHHFDNFFGLFSFLAFVPLTCPPSTPTGFVSSLWSLPLALSGFLC